MERVSSLMDATMDASGGSEEEQGSSQILRDYREVNARIRKAGLYETRDSFYLGKYAVVIALLVAAWLVVAQIPRDGPNSKSWSRVATKAAQWFERMRGRATRSGPLRFMGPGDMTPVRSRVCRML